MSQKQTKKTSKKETQETTPEVVAKTSESAEAVKASTDKLMDKIDDILNEFDAEVFIANYVQKGGQ